MNTAFRAEDGRYILLVEQELAHPPEKVWRSLTELDQLAQWFPAAVEGEWVVGAPLRFTFKPGQAEDLPDAELRGEVLSVDEPRLLEFRWGSSLIRLQLEPDGEGTRFRLSETQGDPSWGARNAAGWEMCVENLDLILDGAAALRFLARVWKTKFEHYSARFEPDFGPQNDPSEHDPLLQESEEL